MMLAWTVPALVRVAPAATPSAFQAVRFPDCTCSRRAIDSSASCSACDRAEAGDLAEDRMQIRGQPKFQAIDYIKYDRTSVCRQRGPSQREAIESPADMHGRREGGAACPAFSGSQPRLGLTIHFQDDLAGGLGNPNGQLQTNGNGPIANHAKIRDRPFAP